MFLIEFAYNNIYHSSIGMALFEVFYGRRCRYSIGFCEVGEFAFICTELVHDTMDKV